MHGRDDVLLFRKQHDARRVHVQAVQHLHPARCLHEHGPHVVKRLHWRWSARAALCTGATRAAAAQVLCGATCRVLCCVRVSQGSPWAVPLQLDCHRRMHRAAPWLEINPGGRHVPRRRLSFVSGCKIGHQGMWCNHTAVHRTQKIRYGIGLACIFIMTGRLCIYIPFARGGVRPLL